ncbi:AraC family transcriptional regulator [Chitinophaga pinensis]|uniref:AraC family transcriptional regulator n=1 Tax=Chitinophaga pinensis TaxID=79329 RepID=A0A5C6LR04_9BACT|nr:AraC family transcriptional regulator [Chitinophaga pinensis]TWV96225.1 AraC family transcriptional regulator [Chitinophaga pinensis]
MSQQGQLLTEDAQQHFFKIAYPEGIFRTYVDYYFEIQLAPQATTFYINGLPSVNTLIAFNINCHPWTSVKDGTDTPIIHQQAALLGQISTLYTGAYCGGMHTFFVKLRSGISPLLFREAAGFFENTQAEFSYLWKDNQLEEQIQSACNFETRIQLFQHSLLQRIHDLPHLYKVERLHRIMRSFHTLQFKGEKEIETICKNNWISYSSARRDFLQYVGFTPKYSQQIIRFKNALKAYKKEGYQFYCEDYGYTDFSHFAKDARLITGRPPSALI